MRPPHNVQSETLWEGPMGQSDGGNREYTYLRNVFCGIFLIGSHSVLAEFGLLGAFSARRNLSLAASTFRLAEFTSLEGIISPCGIHP